MMKQNEEPIASENLAEAINRISDGMKRLEKSGLNRRAIVALLVDETKMPKYQIENVLNGLGKLKDLYCGKRELREAM